MNFHSTTPSGIQEIDSTCTVEHRATLHYSDSRNVVGDATVMVVDKNVEEVRKIKKIILASLLLISFLIPTAQAFTSATYVDYDLNDDGIFDICDLTLLTNAVMNSTYDYKYDINLDLSVDIRDLVIMCNALLNAQNPQAWKFLESNITKIDKVVNLTLYATKPDAVETWFMDFCRVEKHNWYHPELRPNPNNPNWRYICWDFAEDTAKCAWKNLDNFGVIGVGVSVEVIDNQIKGHAYNVFCVGDWHDPANWYILEPQNGKIYWALDDLPWYYNIHDGFYFTDYKNRTTYVFTYNDTTESFELYMATNWTFTELFDLGIEPVEENTIEGDVLAITDDPFEFWYYLTHGGDVL